MTFTIFFTGVNGTIFTMNLPLGLQKFYKKHGAASGSALYNLLYKTSVYSKHNSWLSNIGRLDEPSMDPIQLFASFNRSKQDINTQKSFDTGNMEAFAW